MFGTYLDCKCFQHHIENSTCVKVTVNRFVYVYVAKSNQQAFKYYLLLVCSNSIVVVAVVRRRSVSSSIS